LLALFFALSNAASSSMRAHLVATASRIARHSASIVEVCAVRVKQNTTSAHQLPVRE
jgi:hypothetical protein